MSDTELYSLIDIARAMTPERNVPALLNRILDTLIEITQAQRGFLILRENDAWQVAASRNMNQEDVARAQSKISRTILTRLSTENRPLLLADTELADSESLQKQKIRAICALPLGESGAIYLDHAERSDVFRGANLDLIAAFSGLASMTLENARLNETLTRKVEAQAEELETARAEMARRNSFEQMIGTSPRMQDLYGLLKKAAAAPYPVLLQGESGTGKELAARAIHNLSPRRQGPFIAVNCGAISDALLGSELFGHEPGAFTGANKPRTGLFELARGGTLFLDEIGTMSTEMQESLLRVLQEHEIRRVGGSATISVDVRIVTASNADLSILSEQGEFRSDLFYRLNVLRIDLPPLRDRKEDIPALVESFLDGSAEETGMPRRSIDTETMQQLQMHTWPGNVRELENAVRRAVALSDSETLTRSNFQFLFQEQSVAPAPELLHLDEYIRRILSAYAGRMELGEIANRIGVSRKTLWDKKRKWEKP